LLSNGIYNQGSGKTSTLKEVPQEGAKDDGDDYGRPSKIRRSSSFITYLPDDCLSFIFKRLKVDDRNSFGLTCRQWLHIQNINQESLWYHNKDANISLDENCFYINLSKLLSRFPDLKYFSITGIGFLEWPKTLTHLEAGRCKLTPEGINAIVSVICHLGDMENVEKDKTEELLLVLFRIHLAECAKLSSM
ncbi:hypothetical protein MKW94_029443, partial [Papaver nudicaule]|nr:hypothetical protein [Papaver nudicaule]